eukprot:GHVL01003419.1.p1 GENE.GHVL01003419.1~~GHVL01003419.1.p1  ORF type:complete len:146 (+),score=22.06 GHVL01003419.1:20-457(+)
MIKLKSFKWTKQFEWIFLSSIGIISGATLSIANDIINNSCEDASHVIWRKHEFAEDDATKEAYTSVMRLSHRISLNNRKEHGHLQTSIYHNENSILILEEWLSMIMGDIQLKSICHRDTQSLALPQNINLQPSSWYIPLYSKSYF